MRLLLAPVFFAPVKGVAAEDGRCESDAMQERVRERKRDVFGNRVGFGHEGFLSFDERGIWCQVKDICIEYYTIFASIGSCHD